MKKFITQPDTKKAAGTAAAFLNFMERRKFYAAAKL